MEEVKLVVEDTPATERQFRTTGMYTVQVPVDPYARGNKVFNEIWVDGGRYTGEKLRQIRKDGKHR